MMKLKRVLRPVRLRVCPVFIFIYGFIFLLRSNEMIAEAEIFFPIGKYFERLILCATHLFDKNARRTYADRLVFETSNFLINVKFFT